MRRLCITPCGRTKIWDKYPDAGPTPAQEAYIGRFARLCQAYARAFFTDWVILSARHGFLRPGDLVPGNYDAGFHFPPSEVISTDALREQLIHKQLGDFDQVVVLAGRKFLPVITAVFGPPCSICFPLKGCRGIGQMNQRLARAVQAGREIESG